MPSTTPRSIAAVALAAAALGGVAGGGAVGVVGGGDSGTASTTTAVRPAAEAVAETQGTALSARQLYRRAAGSVVHISADGRSGDATGSGFFVSRAGEIVTNAHVVDGATSIAVKLADGRTRRATLVGTDDSSDVALLRIDSAGLSITPLTLADSSQVQVGDPVAAIGNPYGLDRTLTTGVVSAVHRTITAPNGYSISDAIQTDAALNPGNSGGPVLDTQGRVVGVASQVESGSTGSGNTGLGFAVPSSTVAKVVTALRSGGEVQHAYLGVQVSDAQGGAGATLAAVTGGGPAAHAGLRSGDTVVAVDGRSIDDSGSLTAAIDAHAPGDRLALTVQRGGRRLSVDVTLGRRSSDNAS